MVAKPTDDRSLTVDVDFTAPLYKSRINKGDPFADLSHASTCRLCGALVFADLIPLHTEWHKKIGA
jgi:hypothetical protein